MKYLNDSLLTVCKIAACIATDNFIRLNDLLKYSSAQNVKPEMIYETILQSYLFCGFPACIESLKLFKKQFPEFYKEASGITQKQIKKSGEKNCRLIYTSNYKKLMQNMKDLSPDLKDWMINEGYGKVLGRPGLTLRERELINISILACHYYKVQLHSHLKGCINLKVPQNEILKVLSEIRKFSGSVNYNKAVMLLKSILKEE